MTLPDDDRNRHRLDARRSQILDAAQAVFAEKGFHATTIRDIAHRAEMADGNLYRYFEGKTALLTALLERLRAQVMADDPLPPPEEMDLATFVRTVVRQPLLGLQMDDFALFRIVISEVMVNDDLRALYHDQILEPQLAAAEAQLASLKQETGLDETQARLVMRVISATLNGLAVAHVLGDSTVAAHWEKLPTLLADLLLNGLRRATP